MQAITVSTDHYPANTAEDAALLALKNGVLTNELEAAEAEIARLNGLLDIYKGKVKRLYSDSVSGCYSDEAVSVFNKLMYFSMGAVVSGLLYMAIWLLS